MAPRRAPISRDLARSPPISSPEHRLLLALPSCVLSARSPRARDLGASSPRVRRAARWPTASCGSAPAPPSAARGPSALLENAAPSAPRGGSKGLRPRQRTPHHSPSSVQACLRASASAVRLCWGPRPACFHILRPGTSTHLPSEGWTSHSTFEDTRITYMPYSHTPAPPPAPPHAPHVFEFLGDGWSRRRGEAAALPRSTAPREWHRPDGSQGPARSSS